MSTISRVSALVFALPLMSVAVAAVADEVNAVLDPKVSCEKPEYPRVSLANEEQGTVVLALQIGVDGKVVDSKVAKGSGFKNLDKAALKMAQCKYKPVVKDGKPEQAWTKLEYVWQLS